ncbi:hypothetical protein Tsubulata_014902 [Turnera subulata]|uniref:Dol-P-Glc:Glc(2)Man(9)GlcNAc(2)-PP-Dol alpha-1,2-glucosyltransferase n=1 Tax=Turnera subulata TaxID=218843 RepID=A0A9Q0G3E6_9ROSI|nr:hypothetical protein Tsubulata_014902 [Turnera subulata]
MGRVAVALTVSLWVIPISILVNRIVPDPYMDEIFHIPQAQQYCRGNFWSWDPMITTPPGLYYISLGHIACLFPGMYVARLVSSFAQLCSPILLRSVNGVLAVACSIIVYEIIIHLRPNIGERRASFQAVVLALYPLHWFFTFLYYTDVASLTAVLSLYLACLKKKYYLSALLGAIAVIIRQTNIIWVLFVACTGVMYITTAHRKESMKEVGVNVSRMKTALSIFKNSVSVHPSLRKRKAKSAVDTSKHFETSENGSSNVHSSDAGFLEEFQSLFSTSWHIKWKLLLLFCPFFLVLVAFIAFVRWNGSVVLGAKDAHAVSPHFAQIMYFSLVSALLSAPLHFSVRQRADLFRSLRKNRLVSLCQILAALITGLLSVHFFSVAHPYLLADNRHYTFYLWRRVIKAHWLMKYLLVPVYVYSWFSIFSILGKGRQRIWVLAYFLATAAVLVPAPLIEFRYYSLPFFFLMLHSHISDGQSLLLGLAYMIINCFTMIMFLFRPFYWEHEPGIQRFIW